MDERDPLTSHPTIPPHQWIFPGRRIAVIDGDTLDLRLDLFFGLRLEQTPDRRNRFRLVGVDCPESNRLATREAGLAAKAYTTGWMADAEVGAELGGWAWPLRVEVIGFDNFGRILCRVWRVSDGRQLNADLLASGHAVPYGVEGVR